MPSRVNARVARQRLSQGLLATIGRTEEYHPRQTEDAEWCVDAACVNFHLLNEDGELLEPEMLCPAQHLISEFISGFIYVVLCVINVVILIEVQNEDARENVGEGVPKNYALVR